MYRNAMAVSMLAILLAGAFFGFFFAWVCSTMWGLDAAPPDVAISAMQSMNDSVRNPLFAGMFFATAPLLLLSSVMSFRAGAGAAAAWALLAALALAAGNVITFAYNVPLNEALAKIAIPDEAEAAAAIWADYSGTWQLWNQMRTLTSCLGLLLAVLGLVALVRKGRS